ncbi:viral replication polyprotein [Bumble bee Mayfield virus 1-like]|nr:viral replication polyprotein [Bumble bee Mayfield virus 1-like]
MDAQFNDPTFFLSELYAADAVANFSNVARLREEVCASDCLVMNGYDVEYFIYGGRIYYNDLGLTYRISRRWNTWYEQRVYASRHYADGLRENYPFMFWLNDLNAFGSYVVVEFLFNLFGLNDWVFLREIVMATLTTFNTYVFMVVVIILLAKLLMFLGICVGPGASEPAEAEGVEPESDSGEVVAKGRRRKVVAENDSGEVVAKGQRRRIVPENDSGEVVARGKQRRVVVENDSGEVVAKGKRARVVVEANAYDGLAPRTRKVAVDTDEVVQEWCTPEERKASQAKLQASVETSNELVAYLSTCADENVKFKVGLIQAAAARDARDDGGVIEQLDSQEIVADPCAVDAAKRLVHNNLLVVWYYENGNVKKPLRENMFVGSSHGVGLKDRYFITPAHGYTHSKDNPAWAVVSKFSQTVESRPGKLDLVSVKSADLMDERIVRYRARCVCVDRNRDIGLWEIVPTRGDLEIASGDAVISPRLNPGVVQFPDVTNLIAPTGEEWVSMTREMQGIQIIPSLLSSGTVIFTDVFFSYLDRYNARIGFAEEEFWEYQDVFRIYSRSIRDDVQRVAGLSCENTKTKSGDCGGPLIVQNPRIRWKFAGIHVLAAADKVTTMSAMVTMDALYKMGLPRNDEQQIEIREFPFNFDDPNYQLVEDGYGVHLPKGEVVYVGDTLKGLDKQPSSKRVNHRTPFHGCFPEYKVPTVLSVNDPRIEDRSGLAVDAAGNQSILLTESNKSVNHDEIWYDERLLDSCVSDLVEYSVSVLKDHDLSKVDFDVALRGDPDTPHFESLNLKTSNGFPCSMLWGKGRDIWNEERQVVNECGDRYMRNRVRLKEANAKQGIRVFSYWKNTLKDELRKPAKIRTANSRMFTVGPRESTIYTRMLFGRYKAAWTIEADKLFHAVGIDPKTVQWRDLIRSVARHKYFLDEDFTNFDKYALRPFMQAVGEIIIESIHRITGESDEIKQERYVMWSEFIFTLCVNRSTVYMKTSGNPSGNAMTTTLNCWMNVLYHYYIFRTLELTYPGVFSRLTVSDFRQHVSIRVFGDDVILGVGEPFHLCYTPKYIQDVFKLLGQKITPADKSSELAWRPLRDLEFLKRKFRGDQGVVWAPIEIESIYSMYSWSSLFDTDIEGWRNLVFETLIELVHHGRDEFSKFTKTLRDYICSRKFRLVYPKLTEAIFPLVSRSFSWYRSVARNRYYGESDLQVGQKLDSIDFKSLLQSVIDTQCEQESECKGLQLVPETSEIIANLRESISENLDRKKPTIQTDSLSEKMDRIVCESLMGYKKGSMEFVYQAVNSYCQLTGRDPPTIDFEERSPDGRWTLVCSFAQRDYSGSGKTKKEAKHKIYRAVLTDLLLKQYYNPILDGWRGKYSALTACDEQQMDTGLPARKMHVRSQIENADIAGETALTINGIITDQGVRVCEMSTSDGRQMVLDTEPQIASGHEVVSTDYFDFPDKLKRMQYVGEVELGKSITLDISPKMNTRLYLMRSIFKFYHGHAIVKLVVRAPLGYAHKVKVCVGGVQETVDPASKQGFIWDVSNVNTVYVHAPFIKEVFMTPFDQPSCRLAIMPIGTPTSSTVTPTPVYIGYQVDYYDVRCYISRHVTSAMVDRMFVEPTPNPPKPPPMALDQQEISVIEPVLDYAMIGSMFINPFYTNKLFLEFYDKFPQKELITMSSDDYRFYHPYLSLPYQVIVHDLFNGDISKPMSILTRVWLSYQHTPTIKEVIDDIRRSDEEVVTSQLYDAQYNSVAFTDRQLLAIRAPTLSKESKDILVAHFPKSVEFKLSFQFEWSYICS